MRSFDVQCTSYNPEVPGKPKSTEFVLQCFFDTGRRWEPYENPCSGMLVHIVGQLIRRYKKDNEEKPAVLITDFVTLPSPRNMRATASGTSASSPEISTPTKQRYRPKSSKLLTSLVTPEKSRLGTFVRFDNADSYTAVSPTVLQEVTEQSTPLSEDFHTLSDSPEIEPVIESQQRRPKRIKRGKRSSK
jgi:hypothetical protein